MTGVQTCALPICFPVTIQSYNFNNAGLEDIERAIELIIDEGKYETPEPYQNLQLGITKMQQAYLLYRSQNAPEERLELFRRWIEDAAALLKKAQEPAQPLEQPSEQIVPEASPATEEALPEPLQQTFALVAIVWPMLFVQHV